jgi:hypothetical protein
MIRELHPGIRYLHTVARSAYAHHREIIPVRESGTMKSEQSLKTLPRRWRTSVIDKVKVEPMADSDLLASLHNRGIALQDISIDVLRLKSCESKKLNSLGILNLEQLSNTSETALRIIPHFGILKVKRLKARLTSHLNTLTSGDSPVSVTTLGRVEDQPPMVSNKENASFTAAAEIISELEAVSESLERLRRRIRLYIVEIKKDRDQ